MGRGRKVGIWICMALMSVVVACGAQVQDKRQQAPIYEVDEDVEVALVSIDIPEWVEVGVSGEDRPEPRLLSALSDVFDKSPYHIVDRMGEGVEVVIGPKMQGDSEVVDATDIDAKQAFVAEPVADVPVSIEEPLILGVQVVGWSESDDLEGRSGTRRRAHTDVVYSLWSRDGQEIETRRVRLQLVPGQELSQVPELVPGWPRWLHTAWEHDESYRPQRASHDAEELFGSAAELNATAFAYPYGTHEVPYSAPLVDDSELAEGLDRIDDRDWVGAYEAFARVIEEVGESDGAHFNMGVVAELIGDDALAIEHFRRANELNERGMYRRHLESVELRQGMRVNVGEMVLAAEAARQAQIVSEQEAASEEIDDGSSDEPHGDEEVDGQRLIDDDTPVQ